MAKGASSLVAKEVRGAALNQFASTLQPEERILIKWDEVVRQKADTQDLSNVVMSKEEAIQQQQSPEFQRQQQMQQMQLQLQLALAQAQVAKAQAETEKLKAAALSEKVGSVYAAMQAGGVAAQQPGVAAAGDSILRSSGWQDATPQQPGSGAEQGQPVQPQAQPESAFQGERAGIETKEIAL